jgi:hypothetical protein
MVKQIGDIKIYSVEDLQQALGVNARTIRDWFNKRRIIGQKLGTEWHVTEENLKRFLSGDRGDTAEDPKKKHSNGKEVYYAVLSFRHTNASMRILANQNIKYLSQQLEHSGIQITLDIYGHLFNDIDFYWQQVSLLEGAVNSVRKSLENSLKSGFKSGLGGSRSCFYLVGDAGLEPTAFGSGDQRSIQLS